MQRACLEDFAFIEKQNLLPQFANNVPAVLLFFCVADILRRELLASVFDACYKPPHG